MKWLCLTIVSLLLISETAYASPTITTTLQFSSNQLNQITLEVKNTGKHAAKNIKINFPLIRKQFQIAKQLLPNQTMLRNLKNEFDGLDINQNQLAIYSISFRDESHRRHEKIHLLSEYLDAKITYTKQLFSPDELPIVFDLKNYSTEHDLKIKHVSNNALIKLNIENSSSEYSQKISIRHLPHWLEHFQILLSDKDNIVLVDFYKEESTSIEMLMWFILISLLGGAIIHRIVMNYFE